MKLQPITEKQIKEAVSFVWQSMQNVENITYPIFVDEDEICQRFIEDFKRENSYILACTDNNKIEGVLCFYTIPHEKYLQTTAVYILNQNKVIANEFIYYMEKNFSAYTAYIGIEKRNIFLTEIFLKYNFKLVDDSANLNLTIDNFKPVETFGKIIIVNDELLTDYLHFHDQHFCKIYWNSERISENISSWLILVSKIENSIVGSILMKIDQASGQEAEIYAIVADSETLYKNLISDCTQQLQCIRPNISNIVFMAEKISEMNAAISVGFQLKNYYCCFIKTFADRTFKRT